MNVLITGGGTQQPIDNVRSITNFSTGRTSKILSEYFVKNGHFVTCITSKNALKPHNCKTVLYSSYDDLQSVLKSELSKRNYNIVIHAAAVSDYSTDKIIIDRKEYDAGTVNKIPSGKGLTVIFKVNPKLIYNIKKWSKEPCVLFGFKLTDNASLAERLEAVKKVFEGSNENKDFCPDYVISNDKSELKGKSHPCKIYDNQLNCISECDTVENMAQVIESCALKKTAVTQVTQVVKNAISNTLEAMLRIPVETCKPCPGADAES